MVQYRALVSTLLMIFIGTPSAQQQQQMQSQRVQGTDDRLFKAGVTISIGDDGQRSWTDLSLDEMEKSKILLEQLRQEDVVYDIGASVRIWQTRSPSTPHPNIHAFPTT